MLLKAQPALTTLTWNFFVKKVSKRCFEAPTGPQKIILQNPFRLEIFFNYWRCQLLLRCFFLFLGHMLAWSFYDFCAICCPKLLHCALSTCPVLTLTRKTWEHQQKDINKKIWSHPFMVNVRYKYLCVVVDNNITTSTLTVPYRKTFLFVLFGCYSASGRPEIVGQYS